MDKKIKSLLDSKTIAEISQLEESIAFLERRLVIDRMDREETRETEAYIEEYKEKIDKLIKAALNKKNVPPKLPSVSPSKGILANLKKEYADLDARTDDLVELMFGCELNMNPQERSPEVLEQAAKELERYRIEYNAKIARMRSISEQIKNHTY